MMKNYLFGFFMLSVHLFCNAQITYYVDQQNGNNSNNGISTTSAFESISSAISIVNPGDTVSIIGEYKNESFNSSYSYSNEHDPHLWHGENSIQINNLHGTASSYITLKAYSSNTVLKGDGANIFRVLNSSYLKIEGFEIKGQVPNIPISTANALQFVYIDINNVGDPNDPTAGEIQFRDQDCISNCIPGAVVDGEIYSSLNGVNVSRPSYIDTRGFYLSHVHHIEITNNVIHDMPGGGLRVSHCEDIDIVNNEVFACSRKSFSGTHALVVTKATSTRSTDDYRIKILRNKIHHNFNEQYSWSPSKTIITPHIDEGKGISLQRNETTYDNNNSININWENGRILVANNICYYNGFSGVHSNDGNRIDMINNTCYFNSYTKSITEGATSSNGGNIGISAQGGSDIRIINNISIIDSGLSKSAIASNLSIADGLIVKNNLVYGTSQNGTTGIIDEDPDVVAVQINTQLLDPLFVDPLNFDFSLQQNSPAIDNADIINAPIDDYFENPRDTYPDIGAIEYNSNLGLTNSDSNSISFFPNPVNNQFTVQARIGGTLSLYNQQGKLILNQALSAGESSINMESISNGVYICIFTFESGVKKVQKLIKF